MNPLAAALRYYHLRSSWLGDGGQPVPLATAQQRTNICLQCPQNTNQPLWESLTQPIANQLRRQIQLKAQMQLAVQGEDGLHSCKACDCVLSLKVWAPLRRVKETTPLEKLQQQGPRCWILQAIDDEAKL